ncbi:MAG: DUF4337 family protein [Gemmataceae bacterium]
MADPAPVTTDQKKSLWDRIVTSTPVVLTVLATAVAGLSSSEMTRSMYFRSLAAQQQSKASDQWNFFQAKRIRGSNLESTVELLQSLTPAGPFDPERLAGQCRELSAQLDKAGSEAVAAKQSADRLAKMLGDPEKQKALEFVTKRTLPKVEQGAREDPEVARRLAEAMKAVSERQTESQTVHLVRQLTADQIDGELGIWEKLGDDFDKACTPTVDAVKELRGAARDLAAQIATLPKASSTDARPLADAVQATIKTAGLDFDGRRYRQEATYNQRSGEIYDIRVRRSAVESDVHLARSKNFFYAMLLLQAGVVIASLAVARRTRSPFWLLAALAGAAGLAFTGYVYLTLR